MKNLKFSRLFAAVTFVAILALAGCKQPDESNASIYGTWESSYGEKFEITKSTIKETAFGMYEIEIKEIEEVSNNSGVFYGLLTKGSDYTPTGTYYAFAYKDLTETTVKVSGGAVSYDTLEEVKEKCTIDTFAYYSECAKQ